MNPASLQSRLLAHVPDDGTWASTARIHDAAFPGQTGVALKRGRARTYSVLRGMVHDGHLQVEWVGERHARWARARRQDSPA